MMQQSLLMILLNLNIKFKLLEMKNIGRQDSSQIEASIIS